MRKWVARALIVAAVTAAAASPAHAHKLKVFATAVGGRIEGTVYFVGGGPARGARILVESADGTLIEALNADDSGAFAFTASMRADHIIKTDSADGHAARTIIPASVLPATLPLPASEPGMTAPEVPEARSPAPSQPAPSQGGAPLDTAALQTAVAQVVAQQIRPLQEQLNAFEDQVRLRDVVGGLGYILGLFGLFAWLRARRPMGGGC